MAEQSDPVKFRQSWIDGHADHVAATNAVTAATHALEAFQPEFHAQPSDHFAKNSLRRDQLVAQRDAAVISLKAVRARLTEEYNAATGIADRERFENSDANRRLFGRVPGRGDRI